MNVYVSLLEHVTGMVQDFEEVKGFNSFMVKEVQSRGYPIVLNPQDADIILLLPTWQYSPECMDEYNTFKGEKMIVTTLEALEQAMQMEDCA